jgi:microcystin-dependent protein
VAVTVNANASPQSATAEPAGAVLAGGSGQNIFASAPDGSTTMNPGMVGVTLGVAGGSQPFSILQPFLCVNFIIALEGIFPSRN